MADIKYRRQALENIATPKKLDDLIQVTSSKAWLVLLVFLTIISVALLWVFFGKIITRVDGNGILFAENAKLIDIVAPYQGGNILTINVATGDQVEKGQTLATLHNTAALGEIKVKKRYLAQLKNNYIQLSNKAKKLIARDKVEHQQKITNLNKLIADEKNKRSKLSKLLQHLEKAVTKGIVTKERFLNEQVRYIDIGQAIDRHKNELITLAMAKAKFLDTWEERLRSLRAKIAQETHTLSALQEKYKLAEIIRSPVAGTVTATHAKIGDFATKNDMLFKIATEDKGLEAIAFVPASKGKQIKPGMIAQIEPSSVKKLEYGNLKGQVKAIATYPTSTVDMFELLKNKNLVNAFLKRGPVLKVRIALEKDPNTYSGYAWTSSKGPNELITPGTLIKAKISVKIERPISLLLPRIKGL